MAANPPNPTGDLIGNGPEEPRMGSPTDAIDFFLNSQEGGTDNRLAILISVAEALRGMTEDSAADAIRRMDDSEGLIARIQEAIREHAGQGPISAAPLAVADDFTVQEIDTIGMLSSDIGHWEFDPAEYVADTDTLADRLGQDRERIRDAIRLLQTPTGQIEMRQLLTLSNSLDLLGYLNADQIKGLELPKEYIREGDEYNNLKIPQIAVNFLALLNSNIDRLNQEAAESTDPATGGFSPLQSILERSMHSNLLNLDAFVSIASGSGTLMDQAITILERMQRNEFYTHKYRSRMVLNYGKTAMKLSDAIQSSSLSMGEEIKQQRLARLKAVSGANIIKQVQAESASPVAPRPAEPSVAAENISTPIKDFEDMMDRLKIPREIPDPADSSGEAMINNPEYLIWAGLFQLPTDQEYDSDLIFPSFGSDNRIDLISRNLQIVSMLPRGEGKFIDRSRSQVSLTRFHKEGTNTVVSNGTGNSRLIFPNTIRPEESFVLSIEESPFIGRAKMPDASIRLTCTIDQAGNMTCSAVELGKNRAFNEQFGCKGNDPVNDFNSIRAKLQGFFTPDEK